MYPGSVGLSDVFESFYDGWVFPGYNQSALWLRRITADTPGAFNSPAWDPQRQQIVSFQDGSYGVGWMYVDANGQTRGGYQVPITIDVGVTEDAKVAVWTDAGVIPYQGPMILSKPANPIAKFDVIIMLETVHTPPRRFVVGDRINPAQVMGTEVVISSKLEKRSLIDIIYTLPTS